MELFWLQMLNRTGLEFDYMDNCSVSMTPHKEITCLLKCPLLIKVTTTSTDQITASVGRA